MTLQDDGLVESPPESIFDNQAIVYYLTYCTFKLGFQMMMLQYVVLQSNIEETCISYSDKKIKNKNLVAKLQLMVEYFIEVTY